MKKIKRFDFYDNISNMKSLTLRSISTDVSFLPTNEKKITIEVEISGFKDDVEEYKPYFESHDDSVEISFLRKKVFSFLGTTLSYFKVLRAKVEIPAGIFLELKNTSGDVLMNGLSLASVRVTNVSGDLNISGGSYNQISLKSTSGDIVMSDLDEIQTIESHSISGDISLKNVSFSNAIFQTVSGDIKISNAASTFKEMNVKSVSGDLKILYDLKPSVHVEFSSVSGEARVDGRVLSAKSKKVFFDLGERPTSILRFKSVSGDMKMDFKDEKENNSFNFTKRDETEEMLRDIIRSKKATKEEIEELMRTLGYSSEEVKRFLNEEEVR